ncbi:cellulose biosynthesis protein BcsF [Pseudomonas sp. R5(2019)]|uniref:cellulose biosynthesis protein BcsF n=1 Tax=Pseudomonas sp. R5(2019) TaxID=2697566 RepID=UPI001413716D|nr:cellulose biosynthesis protein BcsF [Pseudomonas sp. R5(2019)]NBA97829.1 cellulose biosynthesis protein BcsF [Pseudomonas sp. R5(2019)]
MMYSQLLQVIAASCLMTVALVLLLRAVHQRLQRWSQRHLSPRYLKPCGVRRRVPAASDSDEPV